MPKGKKGGYSVSSKIHVELVCLKNTRFSWDAFLFKKKTGKIKFPVAIVYITPSTEKSKIINFLLT